MLWLLTAAAKYKGANKKVTIGVEHSNIVALWWKWLPEHFKDQCFIFFPFSLLEARHWRVGNAKTTAYAKDIKVTMHVWKKS